MQLNDIGPVVHRATALASREVFIVDKVTPPHRILTTENDALAWTAGRHRPFG